jgi:dipeptidyl aminopeptidase/acylaminoacyl peptidase
MLAVGLAVLALSGQIAYSSNAGDVLVSAADGAGPTTIVSSDDSSSYQALAIAPDGATVLVAVAGDEQQLELVPVGGGTPAAIAGTTDALSGSFSPDGKSVVFSTPDGLFTVGSQGGTPTALVAQPDGATDSLPQFSPDGKQVAFARDDGDTVTLELVSSAGGAVTPRATGLRGDLTQGGRISFSPDGSTLVYAGGDGIFSVPVVSGAPAQLTSDLDFWPSFSADGATIEFVRDSSSPHASNTTDDDFYELWSAARDGSGQTLAAEGDYETLALRQPAVAAAPVPPATHPPAAPPPPGTTQHVKVTVTKQGKRYVVRWTGTAASWLVTLKVGKTRFSATVPGAVHARAFAVKKAKGAASATVRRASG